MNSNDLERMLEQADPEERARLLRRFALQPSSRTGLIRWSDWPQGHPR